MVDAMGDSTQLLIRGHGAVVADRTVKHAVIRALVIEENARFQLWASVLGGPDPFTPEEAARIREQNWTDRSVDKRWRYYRWRAREQGLLPFD
jgi:HCOMODA/2-hydroxy-3-carboxy-muconic semialdehyde decarboxylase